MGKSCVSLPQWHDEVTVVTVCATVSAQVKSNEQKLLDKNALWAELQWTRGT